MKYVITERIKANEREVPPDMPPGVWWGKVREYAESRVVNEVPYYDPRMESLQPEALARVRAKALVWFEVTGRFPSHDELSVCWEIRQARKRGEIPHTLEQTVASINDDGILRCGACGARWTPPHPDRCKLCDKVFLLAEVG